MTRDKEDPAEEQSEISPSSAILHTSPLPPPPHLPLHQPLAPGKQDITVSPAPRTVAAHSRASISVFIVN